MVPANKLVPAIPAFPADVLAAPTLGEVLQDQSQTSTLPADQGSLPYFGDGPTGP